MTYYSEADKIRERIMPYLNGDVCDIGCGGSKILPTAFGIDGFKHECVDFVTIDLYNLREQLTREFDVVFSSHNLEHLQDDYAAILSWSKIVKQGGYLILYLPDGRHYDNHENTWHFRDYTYDNFLFFFKRCFCGEGRLFGKENPAIFEISESGLDVGQDKYSFYLVAKKYKPMIEEDLMYASDEDVKFYLKCVEGLPTLAGLDGSGKGSDGIPLPYGLGSHSIRCLREIVDIVKPKQIFSIGTNMGWSDSLWLELAPKCTLVSCDISTKKETIVAAETLRWRYGSRYQYKNRNDSDFGLAPSVYDLIFIDGGHLIDDVIADIWLALDLKIPYIAFDDILPQFGQVKEAIDTFGDKLEQLNINGNIALYKNKTL